MKKGDLYRGFSVVRKSHIEEIAIHVLELEHEKTGAKVIHVEAEDKENLFAIAFRTYPSDDTGVAHILEHTTLCGSDKYTVRDPFFSMLRRSSNTFMNAFTAKLWTAYPAASLIEKDFYNLLDVYLDAVFHPLLRELSFRQEGHRLEFEDPEDITSPLMYKGVVYNEMKGVFSNPSSAFWRQLMAGVSPNHPYGNDSGGVPKEIPKLTYEDLIRFHQEYYHPSRAIFFFYGDLDLKKHLDFIGERILDKADRLPPIPPLSKQHRFHERKRETTSYPTHETDLTKKTFIGFSWLTMDINNQEDLLAFTLLDSVLMDTDASLLKHKLINSGLCIDADSALDPDAKEIPYSIVCKGCDAENADAIEKLLFQSLREIAEEKIPHKLIESSMHQLEFSRSEIGSDYQPYSLEIFGRTILPYMQGGPLLEGVKIHSLFEKLAKLVIEPDFLSKLIDKYLLQNMHMYRLVMQPDPTLLEKVQKEEREELDAICKKLSTKEKKALVKQSEELVLYQETHEEEDVDCLPILSLNDIPKEVSYYPINKEYVDGLAIYHHTAFTNQITYVDLLFDLPQIAEEDLPYLRLFASLITELGAGGRNYVDNLRFIHEHVGGVWTNLSLNVQRSNPKICYPTISICSKALGRKNEKMFHLLKDFVLTPDFKDRERIKELITQSHSSHQHRLNSSAIGYALKESAAGFSSWNHVNNIWHGFPYYKFLETLVGNLEENLSIVIEKFEHLTKTIFPLNTPHLILSSERKTFDELVNKKFYGLSKFSDASGSFQPWVEFAHPKPVPSMIKTLATPIAHNAQSISTINMNSPYAHALKIASYLFENLEIHLRVREQGGAYSSGVKFNILIGRYQFYSSRDPNIFSTYAAFEGAVARIANGDFSDRDLQEACLSYIQDVDRVVSPGSRASVTYYQNKVGLTKEVRQEFRDKILKTTREEVIDAVRECLSPKMKSQCVRVSYASKDLYERDAPKFKEAGYPSLVETSIDTPSPL